MSIFLGNLILFCIINFLLKIYLQHTAENLNELIIQSIGFLFFVFNLKSKFVFN